MRPRVALVIPTLDEEDAIGAVLAAVPRDAADEIIVADSGSTDRTVELARRGGARVVTGLARGYGLACQAGAAAAGDCDILVFLDGDGSDPPESIPELVAPIAEGRCDFVVGSRVRGRREPGSLSLHQIFAGRAVGFALRLLYGVRFTDMGPFRAIRRDVLATLGLRETSYGWNLEMQMRAASTGLRVLEIPVVHRRRVGGASKVSGSLSGTMKASFKIAATLARIAWEGCRR